MHLLALPVQVLARLKKIVGYVCSIVPTAVDYEKKSFGKGIESGVTNEPDPELVFVFVFVCES
jgi:hypothetical protein